MDAVNIKRRLCAYEHLSNFLMDLYWKLRTRQTPTVNGENLLFVHDQTVRSQVDIYFCLKSLDCVFIPDEIIDNLKPIPYVIHAS